MQKWLVRTCFCLLAFAGCKSVSTDDTFEITVLLQNEPDNLNPILSKSSFASQIEMLLIPPMAEYDPLTLQFSPFLLSELPTPVPNPDSPGGKGTKLDIHIRPEANWADGKPITAQDYLFTLKAVYNPYVQAASWKGSADFLTRVVADANDPKKLTVYIDSSYMLPVEIATNWNIYPAHIYDPNNLMSNFTLEQLRDKTMSWNIEQDSLLKSFAGSFSSPHFTREVVSGGGAYELENWTTGESIILRRKKDWWGNDLANAPSLVKAYPQVIRYRFIEDASSGIAALKAGEITVMSDAHITAYNELKNDPTWKDKLAFASPQGLQVNYLELNTRDSILADERVRKALAYCLDYKGIIDEILEGLGSQALGPIHPSLSYFDQSLQPIQQDVSKAISLLQEAGWSDTNQNGIPDKIINGKRTELTLSCKISSKDEGSTLANLLKENAGKAGFDIRIDVVDPNQIKTDARQFNFQIMPLRIRTFPGLYDPYTLWHSESDVAGGSNRSGFHSPQLDAIIEGVRKSSNSDERNRYYKEFQQYIYNHQAVIYLYHPYERIIYNSAYDVPTSPRRPGYFENLIRKVK